MRQLTITTLVLLCFVSVSHATPPTISSHSGAVATGQILTLTGTTMLDEDKTNWRSTFQSGTPYGFESESWDESTYLKYGKTCADLSTDERLMGSKSARFTVSTETYATHISCDAKYYYNSAISYGRAYVQWQNTGGLWIHDALKLFILNGPGCGFYIQPRTTGNLTPPDALMQPYSPQIYVPFPNGRIEEGRWYALEYMYNAPNGIGEIWVDGVSVGTTSSSSMTCSGFTGWNFGIPDSHFAEAGTELSVYVDGLTVSSSRVYPSAIVEIGNSSTYHAGVYRAQEVVYLSDTSIQIKVDLTGMGSGPYFMWITNNKQERVALPYNLSGEPSGVDVTDPVTTATPAAGEYLTGTEITLSCTDNVACGTTYYCWGAACTPTTEYSIPIAISSPDNLILRYYSTDSSANDETVQTATYTILPSDTTAPVISNMFPIGTLAWGTTLTAMQVHTDENATCKYGTSDVAYGSLPSTFSTTGGASHSQTLSSLTNGSSTTYYVRCADGSGNANTSSQSITVAVSGTAPVSSLLFSDSFEDSNWETRGWYDNTTQGTIVAGGQSGNCLQWAWTAAQAKPANGNASRIQFTPTDELYISFYVKFASDWQGSQQTYHPHMLYILSDLDNTANPYSGLANNYLDTYIEFLSDVGSPYAIRPLLALQDNLRINSGLGTPPLDLSATTENRSATYCNTPVSVGAVGSCFDSGGWYSANTWTAGATDVSKDTWHHVEVYFKMNTISGGIGQSDGVMKKWVDDVLVIDHSDVLYRTNQDATKKWAQLVLAPYIGDGSPITQTMWIDELAIYSGLAGIDNYPPSITAFTTSSSTFNMTVSITAIIGIDDIGVNEYCVVEINDSAGCSWSGSAPTTYTFTRAGSKTLYGFIRDVAEQVSASASSPVTVVRPTAAGASVSGGSM